jgi:hypothetical protein
MWVVLLVVFLSFMGFNLWLLFGSKDPPQPEDQAFDPDEERQRALIREDAKYAAREAHEARTKNETAFQDAVAAEVRRQLQALLQQRQPRVQAPAVPAVPPSLEGTESLEET